MRLVAALMLAAVTGAAGASETLRVGSKRFSK